ncbi:MAG: hypothetical protein EP329_28640 [Deltaproteobacteria bacterium]|nr:MAG: hypothetical protein EP329_28640 [Deltaproteobacteria bacterium]
MAPPLVARLEVSPPMVERLELPPMLTLALGEEAEPTSVASLREPLDKDLLGALAETVRRKTFK